MIQERGSSLISLHGSKTKKIYLLNISNYTVLGGARIILGFHYYYLQCVFLILPFNLPVNLASTVLIQIISLSLLATKAAKRCRLCCARLSSDATSSDNSSQSPLMPMNFNFKLSDASKRPSRASRQYWSLKSSSLATFVVSSASMEVSRVSISSRFA